MGRRLDAGFETIDPAELTTDLGRSPSGQSRGFAGGVSQWTANPRGGGMSPRAALRRLTPRSKSSRDVRPSSNKITPRVGGAIPGVAAAQQAGLPAPLAATDVENLRAVLREDAQLIADRLAQRMEQTQRELLADHASQILGGLSTNYDCPTPDTPRSEFEELANGEANFSPSPGQTQAPSKPRLEHGHTRMDFDAGPPATPAPRRPDPEVADSILSVSDMLTWQGGTGMVLRTYSDGEDQRHIQRVIRTVEDAIQRWRAIEVPVGNRYIDRFVRSGVFVHTCGFVIFVHAITITIWTNFELSNPGSSHAVLDNAEMVFIVWYFIELCLKLASHGRYFVVGNEAVWNIFDATLVLLSVMDFTTMSGALQISYLRSMRLFKISKIIRLFRFLEFMKDVKVMFSCMMHSLASVFWCGLMMIFLLFLFALLILQAVTSHLESGDFDEDYDMLQARFGSVQQTMLVLFQSTTGGIDWSSPYEELSVTGVWAEFVFLLYISFFVIAVWNIITSIFIEKAKALSAPDREDLLLRQRRADMKDVHHLRKLLRTADLDNSGTLGLQEFTRVLQEPHFQRFMESRGIQINEAGTFFAMVADAVGEAEVDIDAMVSCCLCIKGYATSIDLHTLRFEMKNVALENRRCLGEIRAIAAAAAAHRRRPSPSRSPRRRFEGLPTSNGSAACSTPV